MIVRLELNKERIKVLTMTYDHLLLPLPIDQVLLGKLGCFGQRKRKRGIDTNVASTRPGRS